MGEVFHYIVTGKGNDVTELRTIHDWVIKPKMRTVQGTAEINSWGGYEKQYQVRIDPNRLIKHGLTFDQVVRAVEENNRNVGGRQTSARDRNALLVQGVGRTVNIDQIKGIVVDAKDGVPIRVGDVAEVTIGSEIRRGAVTADGKGEVVMGLGFMLMGENTHEVTWSMKNKLDQIKPVLPPTSTFSRCTIGQSWSITSSRPCKNNLFEGGLAGCRGLVRVSGQPAGRMIVALAIPLSMLFAFSGMLRFGIAASLLSLGAIDFGMIVDSSVVMIENCVRHIAHGDNRRRSHDRRGS